MKTHMKRNARETWCGRSVKSVKLHDRIEYVDCQVCLRADNAEQRRNG